MRNKIWVVLSVFCLLFMMQPMKAMAGGSGLITNYEELLQAIEEGESLYDIQPASEDFGWPSNDVQVKIPNNMAFTVVKTWKIPSNVTFVMEHYVYLEVRQGASVVVDGTLKASQLHMDGTMDINGTFEGTIETSGVLNVNGTMNEAKIEGEGSCEVNGTLNKCEIMISKVHAGNQAKINNAYVGSESSLELEKDAQISKDLRLDGKLQGNGTKIPVITILEGKTYLETDAVLTGNLKIEAIHVYSGKVTFASPNIQLNNLMIHEGAKFEIAKDSKLSLKGMSVFNEMSGEVQGTIAGSVELEGSLDISSTVQDSCNICIENSGELILLPNSGITLRGDYADKKEFFSGTGTIKAYAEKIDNVCDWETAPFLMTPDYCLIDMHDVIERVEFADGLKVWCNWEKDEDNIFFPIDPEEKPSTPDKEPVAEVFTDVTAGKWYVSAIQYVYEKGLMSGFDGKFTPDSTMNRAMLVQTLYRMNGTPKVTDYGKYMAFKDVKEDAWYKDAVAWAVNENITTGDPVTGKFNPNASVTREQLATFLCRYTEYTGKDVTLSKDMNVLLNGSNPSSWSAKEFAWAIDQGLIGGLQKTDAAGNVSYDLAPRGTATRAQLATILKRYCEK